MLDSKDYENEPPQPAFNEVKPVKWGYLTKQGKRFKSWKKRIFLLEGRYLLYYVSNQDIRPRGCMDIHEALVQEEPTLGQEKRQHCFSIHVKRSWNFNNHKSFNGRSYFLCCDQLPEMSDWIAILKTMAQCPSAIDSFEQGLTFDETGETPAYVNPTAMGAAGDGSGSGGSNGGSKRGSVVGYASLNVSGGSSSSGASSLSRQLGATSITFVNHYPSGVPPASTYTVTHLHLPSSASSSSSAASASSVSSASSFSSSYSSLSLSSSSSSTPAKVSSNAKSSSTSNSDKNSRNSNK